MTHGEPCQPAIESRNAIWINGHPNGSIMVRLSNLENEQDATKETLKRIEEGIDDLPKKLFIWLSILTLFFGLVTFLAPSLRKAMNLTEVPPVHEVSQDAKIPPLGR